jgi:hypothetical protein
VTGRSPSLTHFRVRVRVKAGPDAVAQAAALEKAQNAVQAAQFYQISVVESQIKALADAEVATVDAAVQQLRSLGHDQAADELHQSLMKVCQADLSSPTSHVDSQGGVLYKQEMNAQADARSQAQARAAEAETRQLAMLEADAEMRMRLIMDK